MDCIAVSHSPASLLADLGLAAKGDIFALKAFCERRLSCEKAPRQDLEEKKKKLIEQLRQEKNEKKRKRSASQTSTNQEIKSPAKKVKKEKEKSRRISIGWLHYSYKESRFVAVRLARGGGTRRIDIKASSGKEEVIHLAKKLFFPDGQSCNGPANEMKFDLANFKLENITRLVDEQGNRHPFTVQKYFEVHKLTQARIYLTTKKLSTSSTANEETEEDFTQDTRYNQPQEDKGRLWRQHYTGVNKDNEGKEKRLRQELEEVNRLKDLRKTRENRVPPEPAEGDSERSRVSVVHCLGGDLSRFFDAREKMFAVEFP